MSHGSNARYAYYRCTTHAQQYYTGTACHPNVVRQNAIAEALNDALAPVLQGDVALDTLIQTSTPDLQRLETRRDTLRSQLEAINTKRKRLAIALADGTMDAGPYRAADDELVEDLECILDGIRQIDQRLVTLPTTAERQAAIEDLQTYWRDHYAWILHEDHKHELNALLRRLGVRIICEANRVTAVTFLR